MKDPALELRRKQATEAAAAWLERLERTLQPEESNVLHEWLETSLHREVIVQRCRLWHGPEVLAVLDRLIPHEVAASLTGPMHDRLGRPVLSWVLAILLVALSSIAFVGGPPWSPFDNHPRTARIQERYSTSIGGRREILLSDGTRITLNTASTVFVSYGPNVRHVALLRGEAMFDVPIDPGRPFSLSIGARTIEASHARFNLRRLSPKESELIVEDGEIRLLYPSVSTTKTAAQLRGARNYSYGEASLAAGEVGLIESAWQSISAARQADRAKLAWVRGVVMFLNEPLVSALAEISRYTESEFVFADDALLEVPLSGEFRVGDIDAVLRVLRTRFAIDAHANDAGQIMLASRR